MAFVLPSYTPPDFTLEPLRSAPAAKAEPVTREGAAPANFHATTIYPEYFKVRGKWVLAEQSRMDCAVVVTANTLEVVEQRRLRPGDRVVVGRTENGEEGIYVHTTGFQGSLPVVWT